MKKVVLFGQHSRLNWDKFTPLTHVAKPQQATRAIAKLKAREAEQHRARHRATVESIKAQYGAHDNEKRA